MHRKASLWVTLVVLAGWATGAPGLPFLASKVATEYDHAAPLAGRTYSWGGLRMSVPAYELTVRATADKALQTRGWQLVPSGGSATVFGTGNVRGEPQMEQSYMQGGWGAGQWGARGLGPGWAPGFGQQTTTALSTPESHLVLDIFDSGSQRLLFRGVAVEDLSDTDKKNGKALMGSVKQMFHKFPPK